MSFHNIIRIVERKRGIEFRRIFTVTFDRLGWVN